MEPDPLKDSFLKASKGPPSIDVTSDQEEPLSHSPVPERNILFVNTFEQVFHAIQPERPAERGDDFLNVNDLSVCIIKKVNCEKCLNYAEDAMRVMHALNINVFFEPEAFDEMAKRVERIHADKIHKLSDEILDKIDLMIVLGGDGTIMWAAKIFQNCNIPPAITFELGGLNFLCYFNPENIREELQHYLKRIAKRKPIPVENRTRIKGELYTSGDDGKVLKAVHLGLNEILIDRGPSPTIVKLDIWLNEEFLTTMVGDGLIVATPTGSTAYSLSAGGPIIHPEVSALCLTPICPLSLSFRPLILPNTCKVKIKVSQDSRSLPWIAVDGHHRIEMTKNDEFLVSKSEFVARIVCDGKKIALRTWINKLKTLLAWNAKPAQRPENSRL